MGKRKNKLQLSLKNRLISSLNKGLEPVESSYKALGRVFNKMKKAAPLVYDEVEALVKSNVVSIDKRKKIFKKTYLAELGDTITSNLIRKIPSIDQRELKKIVSNRSSQTFIDMLAKGLSVSSFTEKEYTILAKEKKIQKSFNS